jgi:hypothetical protein
MFQAWLDEQKVVPGQTATVTPFATKQKMEAEICRP